MKMNCGKWILESDEEMPDPTFKLVICSECFKKANHTYKFCPHCGSEMKGLDLNGTAWR